jgi:hypothetical protein
MGSTYLESKDRTLAGNGGDADLWEILLQTGGCRGAWRVIEVQAAAPVDVRITWSAGNAAGLSATVTISRAGQVSLFAAHLTIEARNRNTASNKVLAIVTEAHTPSKNVFEHAGSSTPPGGTELAVLPYSRLLRLELVTADGLAAAKLRLKDGDGDLLTEVTAADQGADGVYVGGAASVVVVSPNSDWRLIQVLSL